MPEYMVIINQKWVDTFETLAEAKEAACDIRQTRGLVSTVAQVYRDGLLGPKFLWTDTSPVLKRGYGRWRR